MRLTNSMYSRTTRIQFRPYQIGLRAMLCLVICCFTSSASTALAQSIYFNSSETNAWYRFGENWQGVGVPSSSDSAVFLDTRNLDITSGEFQMVDGGVLQSKIVIGDLHNESGVLAPGQSPGTMQMVGDYTQGDLATIEIELGSENPDQFDQLIVTGNMTLAGILDVSLYSGFNLELGQEFLIADSQSGMFDGLNDGDLVAAYRNVALFIDYSVGEGNAFLCSLQSYQNLAPQPLWGLPFFCWQVGVGDEVILRVLPEHVFRFEFI